MHPLTVTFAPRTQSHNNVSVFVFVLRLRFKQIGDESFNPTLCVPKAQLHHPCVAFSSKIELLLNPRQL